METTSVKLVNINAFAIPALAADIARELSPEYKYDLSITKHRERKTVSQNAYFHKLIDLLRLKMNYSFTRMKNEMVTSYGTILDDTCVLLNIKPEIMREWERPHAKYIKSEIVTDAYGVKIEGHWYRLYKNVEDMDTYEMAKLITGTVQECENLGMDVMTPSEKAYLNELLKGNTEHAKVNLN